MVDFGIYGVRFSYHIVSYQVPSMTWGFTFIPQYVLTARCLSIAALYYGSNCKSED